MRMREGARIILLNEWDGICLFRHERHGDRYWIIPGGGVDHGETWEQAAIRELAEETGLREVELGPCVWTREKEVVLGGEWIRGIERYFLVRVSGIEMSNANQFDYERDALHGDSVAIDPGAPRVGRHLLSGGFARPHRAPDRGDHPAEADDPHAMTGYPFQNGSITMSGPYGIMVSTINLNAPDPLELARFYERLLGWTIASEEPDWVVVRNPEGGVALSFQTERIYVPPVWPARPGEQQMMMHLEIRVDDLDGGCAHAKACGATLADYQPQDDVRVHLDPAGHPFCLWLDTEDS